MNEAARKIRTTHVICILFLWDTAALKGRSELVIYANPSAVCGLTATHTPLLVGEEVREELERKNLGTFISI